MKKTFLLFLLIALVTTAFSQTADEVINKFIQASGGKEKLNAIKTLQYNQLINLKLPMGNFDLPIKYYKERNKLFRMEASMQFGPQPISFFTVISDTAAYVMLPAIPMLGNEGGLKKLEEKDRQLQVYQLNADGYFADLVDYASRGGSAVLLKDEKINKEDCYKIKLTMKTGQEITYYINKATNLVVRVDTKGTMAASVSGMGGVIGSMGAGRVDKMEVSTIFSDYIDVDGVKFPTKVLIKSQMGDSPSTISDIRINQPLDARVYSIR